MRKAYIAIILVALLSGCQKYWARVENSYTYNNIADYEWLGSSNEHSYYLRLLRNEDTLTRFKGIFIVNEDDTISLDGIVKGNSYPTWFKSEPDSIFDGFFMIWYMTDSISVEDRSEKKILSKELILYKKNSSP